MIDEDGLFALDPAWRVPDVPGAQPGEQLSAGRRLTLRQHADLAAGRHPLTGGRLHPQAAPAEPRDAPGRRCGNCRYRTRRMWADTAGNFPKCWFGWDGNPRTSPPRATRGPATDVRAYWPACTDHQSPD